MSRYGEWKTYQEVLSSITAITGEDFVKAPKFTPFLEDIRDKNSFSNSTLPNLSSPSNRMGLIKDWFIANGLTGDPLRETISQLKDGVFSGLTATDIEPQYYDYLQTVGNILTSL